MDLDWLIVGGGIHGVHIAVRLVDDGGVDPERLCIVDPAPRLLARWRERARVTGMSYLRSPLMHHIDTDPYSLARFASEPDDWPTPLFTPPNGRPALRLFDAHCDNVIDRRGLGGRHVRARACGIDVDTEGVGVQLESGANLRAAKVVLAIGAEGQPAWPSWAAKGRRGVEHVFDANLEAWGPTARSVAVVGGGITAAQIGLRLARDGHRVSLVSRHPMRVHQYDSDPGWFGPKFMSGFERIRDLHARRRTITEGRHRGSMPPDVVTALQDAVRAGEVTTHESEVERLEDEGGRLRLSLSSGESVDVDEVLLATGVSPERPGGAMVDRLIAEASLPCAPCGYPVLDDALRWHPRIQVSGPLAELTIGPVARNIAGARRAAERIVASLPGTARQVGQQGGPSLRTDVRVESRA
ncbi:MAG: FAD/NAD(P)-binding protein [Planctomycetota bacterium]